MDKQKPRGYWTLERCMEDALRFTKRREWLLNSKSAYEASRRNGWAGICCAHMVGKGAAISATKTKWTLECLLEDAKRFDSISEWMRSNSGAYDAAWRQGVVEQCTAHMQSKGGDNNVVYLWCDSLSSVYKIGITSDKLGMKRINMCRSHNKMDPRIVFMLKVDDARAVESELLKLGTDPELDSSIDGYTEFRKLTNTELGQAVSIAYEAALSAA